MRYIKIAENDPEPMEDLLSIRGYGRAPPSELPLVCGTSCISRRRRGNFGGILACAELSPLWHLENKGESSAMSPDGGFNPLSCLPDILVLILD